ncbi:DUF1080 domain-containing protein [Gemmatimonadota bacterium]
MSNVIIRVNMLFLVLTLAVSLVCFAQSEQGQPRVATALEGQIPSDAVVLFDGRGLDQWTYADGSPAGWIVENGTMTVKDGSIVTRKKFGDMQIHLEFLVPIPAEGEKGQALGNSGIYIQRNYEVQILDSYKNETSPELSCGSVYKLHAPLVNVTRPPGVWQTFEIIFHAPRFDSSGNKTKAATVTVLHNGVLIQNHVEIVPTGGASKHPEIPSGSILLQDHHSPFKFRNVWVREL